MSRRVETVTAAGTRSAGVGMRVPVTMVSEIVASCALAGAGGEGKKGEAAEQGGDGEASHREGSVRE